ncbi:MAG: response regulator [Gemmatimonadetes bacterium]|nr:response regulator [Gemmatimonadota bacterium]NNM07332.1 response regulator [Gemmatimonadota bacterium]
MNSDPSSGPVGTPRRTAGHSRLEPPTETPIHVVDDDQVIVDGLTHFLRQRGFLVHGFTEPTQALSVIREGPPHLLIVDRNMPGMGGFDLARSALEEDPDIGVIILTGAREVELAIDAFRLGVSDYLLKPLDFGEIERTVRRVLIRRSQEIFHRDTESRMRRAVENRTLELERKNKLLEGVTVGALTALVDILEQKNPHFQGHSQGVAVLSEKIATEMGLPTIEVRACKTAGFLHDIGMIAVPDKLVEKTSPLTRDESAQIQQHCRIGKELLDPFTHLGPVPDYVFHHHERIDGSGYPDGLAGMDIPMGAQVVAVADSFRALVEPRPYRTAHSPTEAIEILVGAAGIWHSDEILSALARLRPSASA